jgi:hypothetical protein
MFSQKNKDLCFNLVDTVDVVNLADMLTIRTGRNI